MFELRGTHDTIDRSSTECGWHDDSCCDSDPISFGYCDYDQAAEDCSFGNGGSGGVTAGSGAYGGSGVGTAGSGAYDGGTGGSAG